MLGIIQIDQDRVEAEIRHCEAIVSALQAADWCARQDFKNPGCSHAALGFADQLQDAFFRVADLPTAAVEMDVFWVLCKLNGVL